MTALRAEVAYSRPAGAQGDGPGRVKVREVKSEGARRSFPLPDRPVAYDPYRPAGRAEARPAPMGWLNPRHWRGQFCLVALITMNGGTVVSSVDQAAGSCGRG